MFEPILEQIKYFEPIKLLKSVEHFPGTILFESLGDNPNSRYSYLCCKPLRTIHYKYNSKQKAPFEELTNLLSSYNLATIDGIPPFQGGLAGLLGYDLSKALEKLPENKLDDVNFPDISLGVYDVVISWDHLLESCWVVSSGYPETNEQNRTQLAFKRMQQILSLLENNTRINTTIKISKDDITSNFSKQSYLSTIQKSIDYIYSGDIFEVNISQRFQTVSTKPWLIFDIYSQLREANKAPFFAFYNLGVQKSILSSSPERFIKVNNRVVDTYPIKGTIKRGENKLQDEKNAKLLEESIKDRAENIMIVDLMRNDLSRVCEPYSVVAPKICAVESFAKVHHLVSHVQGRLQADFNNIDLIKASFPGGSITGAPKIRSMEIIHELEPTSRGPYTGSMVMMGFNGFMDSSILIRTFVVNNKNLYFQAGGAITSDSIPEQEYDETLAKAEGLVSSIT
jgi:para-aminobenzoate synthetase component 1